MLKKVLCVILAVSMLTLAGCGSTQAPEESTAKSEETKNEKAQEEVKTETSVEESKEEAEEKESVFDEATWLPLSDSNETLVLGIAQHASIPDYSVNELTKWLEETSGVKLEFMYFTGTSSEIQQQVALMVAGGAELPDIFFGLTLTPDFVNEMGRDGYLVDLSDMAFSEITPYMNQQYAQLSERLLERERVAATDPVDGKRYRMPMVQDVQGFDAAQTVAWINQKWLDTLGLQKPTNIDELYEVLVAFRDKDPNGNGKKDEIPMIGNNSSGGANMMGYIINAYVYYDAQNHLNATDGQIWAPFAADEFREALKTMNKWQVEGLIEPHCFTGLENSDAKPIYTPEDQVAVAGVICGHSSTYMNEDNPVFYEYEILDYIAKGETDKGGYLVVRPVNVSNNSMIITADCKNPELAMKFIDFIYKDEVVASFRHGVQGINWDWDDPKNTERKRTNIKILDDGQAFFEGIYTWRKNVGGVATPNNYGKVAAAATEWLTYEKEMGDYMKSTFADARYPEEIVTTFAFTSEESEYYNSVKQLFTDYILEAVAKFGTGVWDPNNDADWKNYLDELESIGLTKYLETTQAGYSRMKNQ